MTKVTWLGDGSDAEENTWNGLTFKQGEAVDVTDEDMLRRAKANPYYKVAGDKTPTIEDNPPTIPPVPRVDDEPKNAAFGTEEELRNHRELSIERSEAQDAYVEQRRPRGRPRKSGGSVTANERVPPRQRNVAPSERYGEGDKPAA